MTVLSIEHLLLVATHSLNAKEKIRDLKNACVYPDELLFREIAIPMLEAGQKKRRIGGIDFTLYPANEIEYCACHENAVYLCPTPGAERKTFFRKGLPRLVMTRVGTAQCGICGKSSSELAAYNVCPTCEQAHADLASEAKEQIPA